MKLTNHHMLNMRSRRNGYNSFVKTTLLRVGKVQDRDKWPKDMLDKEIDQELYADLVKHRDTHIDNPNAFWQMMRKLEQKIRRQNYKDYQKE